MIERIFDQVELIMLGSWYIFLRMRSVNFRGCGMDHTEWLTGETLMLLQSMCMGFKTDIFKCVTQVTDCPLELLLYILDSSGTGTNVQVPTKHPNGLTSY